MKLDNYKVGALKRKLKVKAGEQLAPGDLIAKMNAQKKSVQIAAAAKKAKSLSSAKVINTLPVKTKLAVKGLI